MLGFSAQMINKIHRLRPMDDEFFKLLAGIKGVNFKDVPDVTVIYIAEYDVLGNGKMITKIHKQIESDDGFTNISDGSRILIVNAKADDGSLKSQLLKMFLSTEVIYNENFPELSEAIKYFKTTEKGRGTMSETMEQIAKEYAAEIIKENETIQHENEMIQHNRAIIIIKGIETIMSKYHESLEDACNIQGVTVDDYNAAKELTLHDTF